MIFNIIPIEITSMSIFTAICFFGVGVVIVYFYKRLQYHEEKFNIIESSLNDLKIDSAETKAILQGISNQMSDFASFNKMIIQSKLGD